MDLVTQIINRLEKAKAEVGESLASGMLKDFETYRYLAGQRQGFCHALEMINKILTESDDRASQI